MSDPSPQTLSSLSVHPQSWVRAHIREMPAYQPILPYEVLAAQLKRPARDLVKLDANENPYGPLPEVLQALGSLAYPHIYPDPECRKLRGALAEWLAVPVENILAGAGADELIDLLVRVLVEPGEAILDCPPTFGMYRFDGDLNGARVISVPRRADFSLDLPAVELAAGSPGTKLVFVASPNNPHGALLSDRDLERLLDLPLLVVLDEAYVEFAGPAASRAGWVTGRQNLVVLRTFSKWAGLAGLRVGYGVFPDWLMPYLWKARQPYTVSVPASEAACVSISGRVRLEERVQQIVAERERLYAALQSIPWLAPNPSQANFILCRVTGRPARSVWEQLAQAGVLVRYFDKPSLHDCLRISIGRPADSDVLLARLEEME